MMNLGTDIKITRVMDGVTAGTEDTQSSSIVDMATFDGVVFVALLGDITAGGSAVFSIQQNSANSTSGMKTLSDASIEFGADDGDKGGQIDIYRPRERYLRAQIARADENVVIDGVIAIQYKGRKMPLVDDPTTMNTKVVLASPEEAS